MRKLMLTAITAAVIATATPCIVRAEAAAAVAAPDAAALAHKRVLVKRYFTVIHFEQLMDTMMKSMIPPLTEAMRKQNPTITADQSKVISDAVIETMADYTPKLMDEATDLYAETFTEEELTQLVTFYETPIGQSILAKSSAMTPRVTQIVMADLPHLQNNMMTKMCQKLDCSAMRAH